MRPVPKIAEVRWIDSGSWSGWRDRTQSLDLVEKEGTEIHYSVGYVMDERDDGIVLAQSYTDKSEMVADVLFIPKEAIKDISELHLA